MKKVCTYRAYHQRYSRLMLLGLFSLSGVCMGAGELNAAAQSNTATQMQTTDSKHTDIRGAHEASGKVQPVVSVSEKQVPVSGVRSHLQSVYNVLKEHYLAASGVAIAAGATVWHLLKNKKTELNAGEPDKDKNSSVANKNTANKNTQKNSASKGTAAKQSKTSVNTGNTQTAGAKKAQKQGKATSAQPEIVAEGQFSQEVDTLKNSITDAIWAKDGDAAAIAAQVKSLFEQDHKKDQGKVGKALLNSDSGTDLLRSAVNTKNTPLVTFFIDSNVHIPEGGKEVLEAAVMCEDSVLFKQVYAYVKSKVRPDAGTLFERLIWHSCNHRPDNEGIVIDMIQALEDLKIACPVNKKSTITDRMTPVAKVYECFFDNVCKSDQPSVVRALLNMPALDLSVKVDTLGLDGAGRTLLHMAVVREDVGMVKLLLERGASADTVPPTAFTEYTWNKGKQFKEIQRIIECAKSGGDWRQQNLAEESDPDTEGEADEQRGRQQGQGDFSQRPRGDNGQRQQEREEDEERKEQRENSAGRQGQNSELHLAENEANAAQARIDAARERNRLEREAFYNNNGQDDVELKEHTAQNRKSDKGVRGSTGASPAETDEDDKDEAGALGAQGDKEDPSAWIQDWVKEISSVKAFVNKRNDMSLASREMVDSHAHVKQHVQQLFCKEMSSLCQAFEVRSDTISEILRIYPDFINVQDEHGMNIIMHAAQQSSRLFSSLIKKKNVDFKQVDTQQRSIVMHVVDAGGKEVRQSLKDLFTQVEQNKAEKEDIIRALFAADSKGLTPLIRAVNKQENEAFYPLLEMRKKYADLVDVNAQDNDGNTALGSALHIFSQHVKDDDGIADFMAEQLIEAGAEKRGDYASIFAILQNNKDVYRAKALLKTMGEHVDDED